MEKTEYYSFTISRTPRIQREWETITDRICTLCGNYEYIYLAKVSHVTSRKCLLSFIYMVRLDRKREKIEDYVNHLQEIFGCPIRLEQVKQHTASRELRDTLSVVKRLAFGNGHIRGNESFRLINASESELEREVDRMVGFQDFKKIYHQMSTYIDRMKALGKRGNYNVVLVNECEANSFMFIDMLYGLYTAKGVVTNPQIVQGDLDDAVRSVGNTGFLYSIMESWDFSNSGRVCYGLPQEDSLHELSHRRDVFITRMDRAQFERAKESDAFQSLFGHTVVIRDLERAEKMELLKREAKEYGFSLDTASFRHSDVLQLTYPVLQNQMALAMQRQLTDSNRTEFIIRAEDFDGLASRRRKEGKDAWTELEELIGLASVKNCVREIVTLLRNRGRDALPCLHMVFRGNPGTGKTTVARLIGRLFGELGVIKNGDKFVETDRDGLVSQYLGGTAAKTASVIRDAMGGVLFIDEAYALATTESYDYGQEAIHTLVKRLEDHRTEFVCIMAGYTEEMDRLLDSNPGLRDRIQFYIDFPDYTAAELMEIFQKYAEDGHYVLSSDAATLFQEKFESITARKCRNFSNARLVRKIYERSRMKQALRANDNTITAEDAQAVFQEADIRAFLSDVENRRIGFTAG